MFVRAECPTVPPPVSAAAGKIVREACLPSRRFAHPNVDYARTLSQTDASAPRPLEDDRIAGPPPFEYHLLNKHSSTYPGCQGQAFFQYAAARIGT